MPFEQHDDVFEPAPRAVRVGESAALVAAFLRAQDQAERVWAEFERAGFGRDVLAVTASLDKRGAPCVHVRLTPRGHAALLAVLCHGAAPRGVRWRWGGQAA